MENLKQHFTTCSLIPQLKRQKAYLSPSDTEIGFDEAKHIYLLPEKKLRFPISVTGFCKVQVHETEFDCVKLIRNMQVEPAIDNEFDMHIAKLIEWKYSSVFGSLFHAIIEYYFNHVVNACNHEGCQAQEFNEDAYEDYLLHVTDNYNIKRNILTQCSQPDKRMAAKPTLPCLYAKRDYQKFVDIILEHETFEKFMRNHYRFNINNEWYIKDIVSTMEKAFDVGKASLKKSIQQYRNPFNETNYEDSIDKIITKFYTMDRCIEDLRKHLISFQKILFHLPLNLCCDIKPEYIAFDEEHGLAGSVDLIMRSRFDPYHLFIYDWKTCKKIFNSFRRQQQQTNQLTDYSCQLHTYANLITCLDSKLTVDLFIVNITSEDSCIYNVKNFQSCNLCFDKFKYFKLNMYDYE